jgi:hypothetical protein
MRVIHVGFVLAGLLTGQSNPPPPVASGNAAIPLAEYNRLVDLAAHAPKRPSAPPKPYTVHSAEFQLRVEKESAAGSLQLQGEVLQKGPTQVALISGLTVLDAQQSGKPLALAQSAGAHSALIEGPAEFDVRLECGLPLKPESGRAGFIVPAVTAGAVRMLLTVPGEETSVNIDPGLVTGRTSSGGRTIVEATLVPGKAAQVWWSARLPVPGTAMPAKDLRFLSDVKTMISVTEAEIAMTALADITVVQGQASRFELVTPEGFEVTAVTGATLADSDAAGGRLGLQVTDPALRSHQFLIAMAKPGTVNKAEIALPGFAGTQRETGEVLVEGQGALELAAREKGGLRRMDLREASQQLRALADHSVQAAFRYQRRTNTGSGAAAPPGVDLEWVRFPGAPILPALSERAVATTLVTREGRSLTEVRLRVRNRSQSFVRIVLPPGAAILSAEVAGEKVKPVEAKDGIRVPMLRPGFRAAGPYVVSFVFSHAGAPFAKKGVSEITLPRMDVPIGAVEWEVFLPSEFRVAGFGGDVLPANAMPQGEDNDAPEAVVTVFGPVTIGSGEIGGKVIDATGATVPRARIQVAHEAGQKFEATTNNEGLWRGPGLPSGRVQIAASAPGFIRTVRTFDHQAGQPLSVTLMLQVGAVTETVEVSSGDAKKESQQAERLRRQSAAAAETAASSNVMDLQKRLAGVLPIAVTVPRTGNAYRFVRPLVVDEETRLTFQYRAGK